MSDAPQDLKALAANVRAAETKHAADHQTIASLEKRGATAKRKADAIRTKISMAAQEAVLTGQGLPADAEASAAMRKLTAESEAVAQALPIACANAEASRRGVDAARAELAGAKLAFLCGRQEDVRQELVSALAGVAPMLARLQAIESEMNSFDGAAFIGRPGHLPRPWSGKVAVAKFLAGLIDRLRPLEFAESRLSSLTQAELNAIRQQIEEATK